MSTDNDQEVEFIAFHGINQFMLDEYRQEVLHTVLGHLDRLPSDRKNRLLGMIKRYVKLPGFRNSAQAPLSLKIKGSGQAFEKHPDFVAQVLMAWSELLPELRQQVYDLLIERKWELLPPDTDRSKLPGFLVVWPKEENYDTLGEAFKAKYPDVVVPDNDLRLMIVWLSGRLPFDMDEE